MFPTILNYNGGCRVMLSQSKNACWQELVEMYTGMKRFGPPPVASTFNTLLNGMLLLGFMQDQSKLYYFAIVLFDEEERFEEAMNFVSKMERERCNPDLLPYNVILRELFHRDRLDDISELIQVMDQKGLSPDS
ncbi:hypothetical protein F383_09691 [Gossypium arboreum]|uniref:Uncharacterized protein n=1 Tax=Gossypium arboreum TaxID=29729 RepID=A0A0B0PLB0_GOSAR|nr:hypothetical protein F383_09691 [Gossypium arboreum]